MMQNFKKLTFIILYNLSLFFILLLGIQNSNQKTKVNFLTVETVSLPISFILGVSFISGSIIGNLITLKNENKKSF